MTSQKPCDFPHVLGRIAAQAKPSAKMTEEWSDEDHRQFGEKDFEAWNPADTTLPTNAERHQLAVMVRLCYAINCKTKAQLVESLRKPDSNNTMDALARDLVDAERMIEAARLIVGGTFARLLAAGCAAEAEGETQCA